MIAPRRRVNFLTLASELCVDDGHRQLSHSVVRCSRFFYLLLKLKHCKNNKCCDINKIYCFISPPNDKKLSFYHFFPSSLSCACLSSFVGLASFFAKHGVRRRYGMEIVEAFRIVIFYQFEMRWKKWYFHGRNLWCENINNFLAQLVFLSFSHDTNLCLSIALREEEENRN